jgi:hypothetical protein
MGNIYEFWLAVGIYTLCIVTIHLILALTPALNLPPVARLIAVFFGGIVLGALVIFAWAGVKQLFGKKNNKPLK